MIPNDIRRLLSHPSFQGIACLPDGRISLAQPRAGQQA